MTVELGSSTVSKHSTLTVHQFSYQHKPKITPYGILESNRGFQLLLKGGWNPEKARATGTTISSEDCTQTRLAGVRSV